ncbi:hypothetical protein F7734_14360 [Scytonema sp. UIC 10036]|uniref:hypothetical protein n=1 Tax=Scytonema sp. UIC 10036 TaxID=2304196 RepID=UPI0012DA0667|nr:hypothetical protein [Scytonema sp. UIC 10036]MUG93542.1 hypothetical protein [Scytonema sp. UIC 10036]
MAGELNFSIIVLIFHKKNDDEWFCHVNLKKDESGKMVLFKRATELYGLDLDLGKEVYKVTVR